jgi:hypothetical protein
MSSSFRCYIDESGDEGFHFSQGSSTWFVLVGLIVPTHHDIELANIIDAHRKRYNLHAKKTLHWRDIPHNQRITLVQDIAKSPARIVAVCVLKTALLEQEKFAEKFRLYFYAVRYLLERVSWFTRDHSRRTSEGDKTAQLIFSNRGGMPYDELREYLRLLKQRLQSGHEVRIDFNFLREPETYSPGKYRGLQLADACASGLLNGLQAHQKLGTIQPAYANILCPIFYRHGGRTLGYGFKLVPREAIDAVRKDPLLEWVRDFK